MLAPCELVWRPVLCSGGTETRNKLVLESETTAFDGYGIELLCRQFSLGSQVGTYKGQPVYSVLLSESVTVVQKICNDPLPNRNRAPLYFPRAGCIFGEECRLKLVGNQGYGSEHDKFAYFVDNQGAAGTITGCFSFLYFQQPHKKTPLLQQILDVRWPCGRHQRLAIDPRASEKLSRIIKGAIHGELRVAARLFRVEGAAGGPPGQFYAPASAQHGAEQVAIKTVVRSSLRPEVQATLHERPLCEIQSMVHIRRHHAPAVPTNTASLLGCIEERTAGEHANAYIVMPFYSGQELMHSYDQIALDYQLTRSCVKQLATGLRFIHAARCNHRDLSLENVMLHSPHRNSGTGACKDEDMEFVIIDFGMSIVIPEAGAPAVQDPLGALRGDGLLYGPRVCGKPYYRPAEFYAGVNVRAQDPDAPLLGFPSDVWALGVIMFTLITGSAPFLLPMREQYRDEQNFLEAREANFVGWLRNIKSGALANWRCASTWPGADPALLCTGRGLRLGAHPGYSLLCGMLAWPEEDRLSIEQVLAHPWLCDDPPPPPVRPALSISMDMDA
jgi:serine/threonine protein kinase